MIHTEPSTEVLAEQFPVLAYVVGPQRFSRLCDDAAAQAAAEGHDQPGALVQRLVVRSDVRPPGVPGRLVADLAALEWALIDVELDTSAGTCSLVPPLRRHHATPELLLAGTLVAIAPLRIVPVAFRLDAFLQRVRAGRHPPLPRRGDQHVAVYRPRAWTCRLALSRGEGHLLGELRRGTPVAAAIDDTLQRGLIPDRDVALHDIDFWIGEGLFTELRAAPVAQTA